VAILLFGIGFVGLAGFLPPPSPGGLDEVAAVYSGNTDGIRAGLLLTCFAGGLLGPWVAAISTVLKRIEGPDSPLTYTQLGLGMVTLIVFTVVPMVLQTAAFRPDRNPDALLALHDLGWITFIGVYAFPTVQCLAITACVLSDPNQRILPRWFGYFNAAVAIGFAPASTIYWFKSGPFAWNGIFPWWIPVFVFFAWVIVNSVVMRKAILEQETELLAGLR
jgi:UDP-N-acetylmuramyl pentapeptide phosphotransferase/UDP-N-acetylglucosamine-1-phosphate transferase